MAGASAEMRKWLCREMAYCDRAAEGFYGRNAPGTVKYIERIGALHAAMGEHECVRDHTKPDGSVTP